MLKDAGFIGEWVEQGIEEGIAKRLAEEQAQSLSQGLAKGHAQGRAEASREILIEQLGIRFGVLPADVIDRVQQASADDCKEWARRLLTADSLDELGLIG